MTRCERPLQLELARREGALGCRGESCQSTLSLVEFRILRLASLLPWPGNWTGCRLQKWRFANKYPPPHRIEGAPEQNLKREHAAQRAVHELLIPAPPDRHLNLRREQSSECSENR